MKTYHIKSIERGSADYGWLKANYMFSFANYYNPNQMGFGSLRVLNDDVIQGKTGFSEHPHQNMEIITVPIAGALRHRDSMGNEGVIKSGEVQVMSAGTGVYHSEFNDIADVTNISQIWVIPNKNNVEPRYDQISFSFDANSWQQIVSPNPDDEGSWIHANAWFHHGVFDKGELTAYQFNDKENGVFIFLIEGEIEVNGEKIEKRDGFGVHDTEGFDIKIMEDSRILLMEVPL
ncbi:pirin family protein [Paracrocinitomix mangrovi]|uniref:pirin family protein n=1 Tax=Paracrocinitomix mangrovi TaxID=2862509 RepID=UPI001C8EBAA0|nr:pirin family protein [Paracrocinitomix mangrovi]UKN02299.1 pirin family protein [Paracrocinitomix mangrovi]